MNSKLVKLILPLLAISLSSCNASNKVSISYGEAIDFARENHDPHQYDGYEVSYNFKSNESKINNVETFKKHYIDVEQSEYYIERINQFNLDLSHDESVMFYDHLINLNSYHLNELHNLIRDIDLACGYIDYGFYKEDDNIGYIIKSEHVTPIINLIGEVIEIVVALIGGSETITFISELFKKTTTSSASIDIDIALTRFGFIDKLDFRLEISDGFVTLPTYIPIALFNGEYLSYDNLLLDFTIDATYSGK